MIHDPIFDKMFKTIRNIDDGKYELQTLDTYYPLIETQLQGKTDMEKVKFIASLLQEIDFLKSQEK